MRIKLGQQSYRCLLEAFRRLAMGNNPTRQSVTEAWTGLGSVSEYRQAWLHGYMEPVYPPLVPRVKQWWKLTRKGAEIVLAWQAMGFTSDDLSTGSFLDHYELAKRKLDRDPPMARAFPKEVEVAL